MREISQNLGAKPKAKAKAKSKSRSKPETKAETNRNSQSQIGGAKTKTSEEIVVGSSDPKTTTETNTLPDGTITVTTKTFEASKVTIPTWPGIGKIKRWV